MWQGGWVGCISSPPPGTAGTAYGTGLRKTLAQQPATVLRVALHADVPTATDSWGSLTHQTGSYPAWDGHYLGLTTTLYFS